MPSGVEEKKQMLPYIHAAAIMLFAVFTLDWLMYEVKSAPHCAVFDLRHWWAGWLVGTLELGYWLSQWT